MDEWKKTEDISETETTDNMDGLEITEATTEESDDKKKKRRKVAVALIITYAAINLLILTVSIILSVGAGLVAGNVMLLVCGLINGVLGLVITQIVTYRRRYICPECGTKRVHHRQFIRTTNKVSSVQKGAGGAKGVRIEYTHYYLDTYVCPNCGECMEENVHKSGGKYYEYNDGQILDQTFPPKEF